MPIKQIKVSLWRRHSIVYEVLECFNTCWQRFCGASIFFLLPLIRALWIKSSQSCFSLGLDCVHGQALLVVEHFSSSLRFLEWLLKHINFYFHKFTSMGARAREWEKWCCVWSFVCCLTSNRNLQVIVVFHRLARNFMFSFPCSFHEWRHESFFFWRIELFHLKYLAQNLRILIIRYSRTPSWKAVEAEDHYRSRYWPETFIAVMKNFIIWSVAERQYSSLLITAEQSISWIIFFARIIIAKQKRFTR